MGNLDQLDLLEIELKMMLDNIKRVREYKAELDGKGWKVWKTKVSKNSAELPKNDAELMTILCKLSTRDLFYE